MSDLVGNPEDRFSRVAAQLKQIILEHEGGVGRGGGGAFSDIISNYPFLLQSLH